MTHFQPFSLNIRGVLHRFDKPAVMGIVNVTPDSFFQDSRTNDEETIARRVGQMIADGVDIIDIGGYSSRPGASDVTPAEELRRLEKGLGIIRRIDSSIPVSVDTFRADVAETAIMQLGADIINDISGGDLDKNMFETVARLKTPYILMHMRGTPETMQSLTDYDDVTAAVCSDLSEKLGRLEELGICDTIVDPGFGFGKTVEQNYRLLSALPHLTELLRRPILAGISRKSMLTRPLAITPADAIAATVSANTIALMNGASILRVHDVAEARQAITIHNLTLNPHEAANL